MEKRFKLQLIEAIVISGFTASILFHITLSRLGYDFYPCNTFLFDPNDRFNDFYTVIRASKDLNPYATPTSNYFPFTYILTYLFAFLKPILAFTVFTSCFILFFMFYIFKNVKAYSGRRETVMSVIVFSAMAYPFLFSLDRGNLENLVFIFLAAAIHYFVKQKYCTSAILLSVPIAMKLYPIVFLPLFFIKRQYKAGLLVVFSSCFLTIISMALLAGGIVQSAGGLLSCLSRFYADCVTDPFRGLQHNVSLLGFLKTIILCIDFPSALFYLYKNYFVAACLLYCMIIYFLCLNKISMWKCISLLVFSMLLLPQVSFDYKLIHIFIPLMLYINTEERLLFDVAYAWLFGLLLIPKDYYWLFHDVSIAVLINTILMIAMSLLIMYESKIMGKMGHKVP